MSESLTSAATQVVARFGATLDDSSEGAEALRGDINEFVAELRSDGLDDDKIAEMLRRAD